jgi:hypothetical protein
MTQTGQADGWIGIKITALLILAGIALGASVFDTVRYHSGGKCLL